MNNQIFIFLYSQYYTKIYYFFKGKCDNAMLAEDLTQDCFIKYLQNQDKIETGKESAFLYTIAYNLFIDHKRKEKVRTKYRTVTAMPNEYESPEFKLIKEEYSGFVQEKINSMPATCREVFLMNKVEKKTYNEISKVIGLSVKSVEKRMSTALKVYREIKTMAYK